MGSIFKREHKYKDADGKTVTKEGKTYWIKYYREGRPYRESTESTSYEQARKILALREGEIVENRFPGLEVKKTTFEDLVQDMIDDYTVNGKKSARRITSLINNLKEHFGGMRAADIQSRQIAAYIKKRKEKAENGTINRELSALRRMFNLGARHTPPKVINPPHITLLKENNVRKGFFEYGEYVKLLAALPEHLKPVLTAAYMTGMRRSELLAITWDQVNLEEGKITLDADNTKTGETRTIYLTGKLYEAIANQDELRKRKYPDCRYVFFLDGRKIGYYQKSWKTALWQCGYKPTFKCKACGAVTEMTEKVQKKNLACQACKSRNLRPHDKLFHDLRRSGVRNLIRSGVPETVAMRISGHRSRNVFDRYNITSENDLKAAAEKLTEYHRKMREKLEQKQKEEAGAALTGTDTGTGSAFEGEIPSFSDSKSLK